jgi:hypothetical protein
VAPDAVLRLCDTILGILWPLEGIPADVSEALMRIVEQLSEIRCPGVRRRSDGVRDGARAARRRRHRRRFRVPVVEWIALNV